MKKRLFIGFIIVAAFGLILAGCGAKPAGPVTLWAPGFGVVGPDEKGTEYGNTLEANVKFYLDNHKNITLKTDILSGTGNSDDEKLLALLATGQAPDVYAFGNESTPYLGASGAMIDLTSLIQKDKEFKLADYFPQAQKGYEYEGKQVGIINGFTPIVIYYNKEIFDKAGLAYPQAGWTWDEFLADAKKLTVRSGGKVTQWGFITSQYKYLWIPWVWNNGADVLSPDGKKADGYMNSQGVIDAVSWYAGLITKEKVAPLSTDWKAVPGGDYDKFLQGKAAMISSGHWAMISLKNSKFWDEKKVGAVELPQKVARTTVLFESGVGITKDSKHVQESWDFVKYWIGERNQKTKLITGIEIPGLMKTALDQSKLNEFELVFYNAVAFGRQPWGAVITKESQFDDAISTAMGEVMFGKKTAKQAMEDATKKVDTALSE